MDPNQAWRDLSDAVETGDWPTARELAQALVTWVDRGGFLPSITEKETFDRFVVWRVCDGILCRDAE